MPVRDGPSCSGCGLPNYAGLCPHCRGDLDAYKRELASYWDEEAGECDDDRSASEPCLAVPCPLCRAPAGEPCREITLERAERRPHNRRRWAYRRERPQMGLFEEVSDGE